MEKKQCVWILNEWDIIEARSLGKTAAKELGFNAVDQAKVTVAISELARNIFKYAGRGQIHLCQQFSESNTGLQVLAIDQGPGMDIEKVMIDGYSTSGGLGCGLSGVKRLMDDFTVTSSPEAGTSILTSKWLGSSTFLQVISFEHTESS
jgi:serine/threonine-protein kinase RsbT